MQTQKERYLFIDGIRGLAIVNMVTFHFLYDIFIIYGVNSGWYSQTYIHIWQQTICQSFIFISGFVWKWGVNKNFQRGIFFNLSGLLISAITWGFIPDEAVWFGILNFFGCAVLLLIPLHRYLQKINAVFGMAISIFLFVLLKNVQNGSVGICGAKIFFLPNWLYQIKILTPFGFPFPGFVSSDYFPILPWIFLYLTGYFFSDIFQKKEKCKQTAQHKIPVLSVIGQKSIWIYLLHQPVCMLICYFIF